MPEMNLKVDLTDSAAMKDFMSQALLRALDDATREKLIQKAIEALLTAGEPYGYGGQRRPSPLEDAFKNAVGVIAMRMAREMLEADEVVKAQIRALLNEAMERAFVTNRDTTIERVANALAEGLYKSE